MPRSAAANEMIRASQRAGILAAARTVFARRGLAATIDEVAAAAGVSHGLAYRYFKNKAELFRALAEEALTRSSGPGAPEPTGTPGERLSRVIRALVGNRRDHPETFQLLQHVLTDPSTPRDLLALAERRGREFRERLRELIVAGQASGEVAGDDPDQLVTAVTACLDGLGRIIPTPHRRGEAGSPAAEAGFPAADIVLRMVMKPAKGTGGHPPKREANQGKEPS
jgi:AcrR family transcriptional regulator